MGAGCNSVCGFISNSASTKKGRSGIVGPPFLSHRIPVPFPFEWSKMPPMNRRTFIGTSVAATLAAAAKPAWAADTAHLAGRSPVAHAIDRVGLQLYTVRDAMKTDFAGTIAKVAATGYKEVEFAGYFDHSPKDVRAAVDRHGLTAPSAHIDFKSLSDDKLPAVIDAAKVVGHEYLVNPWIEEEIRKQPDAWKHA